MRSRRDSTDLAGYYGDLLDEQERSGLSVTEFAEEVGVSAATLYAWRRRLRSAETQAKVVEVSLIEGGSGGSESGGREALTLRVDNRFAIELPANFDRAALARLLAVLGGC